MKLLLLFMVITCGSVEESNDLFFGGATYQCPPCGCHHDNVLFHSPGVCQACHMPLVEVKSGLLRQIDLTVAPVMTDTDFNSIYYSRLIYPAIVLGLVIGLALLTRLSIGKGNVFLALFVFSLSLYAFKYQITGVSYGWFSDLTYQFLPMSFILLIGPSIYFYVRSAVFKSFSFSAKQFWHFVPALVFSIYYLAAFSSETIRNRIMVTPFESWISYLEQILTVLSCSIYAVLSFKSLGKVHLNGTWEFRTNSIRWLKTLLIGVLLIALIWSLLIIVNAVIYDWGVTTITFYPLWLTWATFLYVLSYYVVFKAEAFHLPGFALVQKETDRGLSPSQIADLTARLMELMDEEKAYLDPGLSLKHLADKLETDPKKLSVIFKKGRNTNFFDFVNGYRLEEVKEQLIDPKNSHLTNVAIAFNSGFQSKSSFNAIFKKHEGMTPREYKKKILESLNAVA